MADSSHCGCEPSQVTFQQSSMCESSQVKTNFCASFGQFVFLFAAQLRVSTDGRVICRWHNEVPAAWNIEGSCRFL